MSNCLVWISFVLTLVLGNFYLAGALERPTIGARFQSWMNEHDIQYEDPAEYYMRINNFMDTLDMIEKHNQGNHSFSLGLNRFADMSWMEFKQKYLMTSPQNCSATHGKQQNHYMMDILSRQGLPPSVDRRERGIVSPIKNQGQCGSCWTFSTTGAMESHMTLSYGGKFNLSEQQLVDCAQAFDNHGCSGGLPSQAFEYIHYNRGLMSESDYPYHAKESGKCSFDEHKAVAFVRNIVNITEDEYDPGYKQNVLPKHVLGYWQKDEDQLAHAVAYAGPVSIAFQVASDFKQYAGGVYDSTVCQSDPEHVNHAVLAVGYGVNYDGVPYWIVKNSWGPTWGVEGYFNIRRGKNMCGLADCASFPMVGNAPEA